MIFLSLLLLSNQLATSWYGPAVVDFDLKTSGNPFDFEENDVRVEPEIWRYDGDCSCLYAGWTSG